MKAEQKMQTPSTGLGAAARTMVAVAFGGLALAASAFEAPGDGVYKDRIDWGVMMDLSGPASASQGIWASGFQAYMRKLNEAGGVNGRKINVLAEDSRFNPAQDRINYEKLVSQTPVLGISGMGSSTSQVTLAPTIRADGLSKSNVLNRTAVRARPNCSSGEGAASCQIDQPVRRMF